MPASLDYWNVCLLGTNTKHELDSNSLVDLTTLGYDTDPLEHADWLNVPVIGMSRRRTQYEDIGERVGGISTHPHAQYITYDPELVPIKFPDEMTFYDDLCTVLAYRRIYLYRGEYTFTSDLFDILPNTKAAGVAVKITVEDDYENGYKNISLNIRHLLPMPKPTS